MNKFLVQKVEIFGFLFNFCKIELFCFIETEEFRDLYREALKFWLFLTENPKFQKILNFLSNGCHEMDNFLTILD